MSGYARDEVEQHFYRWREAVDRRDLDRMATLLAPDARGGNSQYGVFEGRDAIIQFARDHWPETVPNTSVWHAIDGVRVVDKWQETLPGEPPPGHDYHYHGISELLYAGSGRWGFMYGIPDVAGLMRAHARWRRDGHAHTYGEIYPGLP